MNDVFAGNNQDLLPQLYIYLVLINNKIHNKPQFCAVKRLKIFRKAYHNCFSVTQQNNQTNKPKINKEHIRELFPELKGHLT